MKKDDLQKIIKDAGFECLDDFVKANLHYLPKDKQNLFNSIAAINKSAYKAYSRKLYTQGDCHNG